VAASPAATRPNGTGDEAFALICDAALAEASFVGRTFHSNFFPRSLGSEVVQGGEDGM
jgi:hypothetical protein